MATTNYFVLIKICLLIDVCLANSYAKKLMEDLFFGYNKFSRPSTNASVPVEIRFRLKLAQILDVHEKNQIMTTIVWMQQEWIDNTLQWDPAEFGGVSTVYVPASMLWLPDVVLYNNADGNYRVSDSAKAILESSGLVTWSPPAIFTSTCPIDVTWFPFDRQICELRFGSWNYDLSELDLTHKVEEEYIEDMQESDRGGTLHSVKGVIRGIDLTDYYSSVEWDVMAVPGKRRTGFYGTSPASPGFVEISYNIELRRKLGFYTVNFLIPCVGISFLILVTFYLPCQSREKVSLSISILISLTVFFLLLVEIIPATSLVLPLFGRYLTFTMILVTMSCISTVFSINFHFRHPTNIRMPKWIHWLFAEMTTSRFSYDWEEIPLRTFNQSPDKADNVDTLDESATVLTNLNYLAVPLIHHNPPPSPIVSMSELDPLFFIDGHFKKKEHEDEVQLTWHYVSNVLDRVFLYCYGIVSVVGTCFILLQAPSVYDTQTPIA